MIKWIYSFAFCLFLLSVNALAMDLELAEDNGFSYLIANDAMIMEEDPAVLDNLLLEQLAKGEATSILFTSPGGALELALQMADILVARSNQLFAQTGRANLLIINEECSSACAIFTTALTSKRDPRSLKILVLPDAQFGFHAPVEMNGDGDFVQISDETERNYRIGIQIDALLAQGVSPEWMNKHRSMFEGAEFTMLAARELCAEESLIIPADSCVTDGEEDVTVLTENIIDRRPLEEGEEEFEFAEGMGAF